MEKKDWYEAGEQIRQLVQDAVDRRDFSQLSSTIADVVNDTVNGIQSALKENLSQGFAGNQGVPPREAGAAGRSAEGAQAEAHEYSNRAAAERIRRSLQEKHRQQEQNQSRKSSLPARGKAPGELTGRIMKWFGCVMSAVFGFSLALVLIICATTAEIYPVLPIAVLALLTGVNLIIANRGAERAGIAKRFRRYTEMIGDRTSCMLEELAVATGRSAKSVRRDLKQMIGRGFFREAYLDPRGEALFTNYAVYQKYLAEQSENERRESRARAQEEAETRQEEADSSRLTPECRELIAEGRKYIRHVRDCNEKIEDPQMSAKLDRLELVITRIFRETEKKPSAAVDLRKMMSYYLPTTRKLLDAYCEMNAQPIRGQNIENTQKEIENALDTINMAFENLLDSFFEDKAWDISSDITVLNTMLAQEGLTGKDFEQKQGGKKNE